MKKKNHKILLSVENCDSTQIQVGETTISATRHYIKSTKLQALHQGIIKDFKTLYRKGVVRKITSNRGWGKTIIILQSMRIGDKSWRNVNKKTIENCFKIYGFPVHTGKTLRNQTLLQMTTWKWNVVKLSPTETVIQKLLHLRRSL